MTVLSNSLTSLSSLKLSGNGPEGITYVLNPAGTATLPLSSTLEVGGTDGGFSLPRLTTAQKNALDGTEKTIRGGVQVFDTTLSTVSTYIDAVEGWFNTSKVASVTAVTGTAGRISSTGGLTPQLDLIATGVAANTYSYPSALQLDIYGRAVSITAAHTPLIAKETVIPAASVITLAGVPVELLPAPGAGSFYVINQMSAYLRYGLAGIPFQANGGGSSLQVYYTADVTFMPLCREISDTFIETPGSVYSVFNQNVNPTSFSAGAGAPTIVNSSVSIRNNQLDFTGGGNSELILTVWYSIFRFA